MAVTCTLPAPPKYVVACTPFGTPAGVFTYFTDPEHETPFTLPDIDEAAYADVVPAIPITVAVAKTAPKILFVLIFIIVNSSFLST